MAVEALVLRGDDRPLEGRRDRTQRNEPTPVVAQPSEHDLPRSRRCGSRDPRGDQDARQQDDGADDDDQQAPAPQGSSLGSLARRALDASDLHL